MQLRILLAASLTSTLHPAMRTGTVQGPLRGGRGGCARPHHSAPSGRDRPDHQQCHLWIVSRTEALRHRGTEELVCSSGLTLMIYLLLRIALPC